MGGYHTSCMGGIRDTYNILIGKPAGRDFLRELVVDMTIM
jgi:hypothetical protein